jgi:hypothetical protein
MPNDDRAPALLRSTPDVPPFPAEVHLRDSEERDRSVAESIPQLCGSRASTGNAIISQAV